jgi:hypothetical protein
MFENAFIENVAINIDGGRDVLVWQWCSENVSAEYTIKLPFKVIYPAIMGLKSLFIGLKVYS